MTRQFWSNVAAVAYKEAMAIRHDQEMMGAIFVQPILQLLLLGFALSNTPSHVPWVVLDRSQSPVSRRFVQEVNAVGYFLPPRPVSGYDEGRSLLAHGDALALLSIPSSFARDLAAGTPSVQLLLDGSEPLTAARVLAGVSLSSAAFAARPEPAVHRPDAGQAAPGPIEVRRRFRFNPTLSDRNFYMASLAAMILTNVAFAATALGLVAERESGAYEQMLALPTTAIEIVVGKLLPYVVVGYGILAICVVAAGAVFGVWPSGSCLALLAVTLPFVLASLGIGVFVSALARTSAQAVFITSFFIMPSLVLSGAMLPYQLMPHPVREIGGLFPLRWYQIASRRIIERGAGFADVLVPLLVLTMLFFAILAAIRALMRPRLG